jgi:CspA family cold shock protein
VDWTTLPEISERPAVVLQLSAGLCLDPNLLGKGYPMASNGTVKFFNHTKGYGFIAPEEGGKDVFVHISALERAGLPPLNEGDRVSFEVEDDPRGRGKQAINIQMA